MAYSDENNTMSLPLLNLKDLMSGKAVADASDYLYFIVDQKADQFLVAAYNEEVAKLDVLRSLKEAGETVTADCTAYDFLHDQNSLLENPFLGLNTSELILLREFAVNQVHFSSVLAIDGPHNAIEDMLENTRTTFQFKIALVFLNPFAGPASTWLCMEDSGKNLQTIVDLNSNNFTGNKFTRVELIQNIISNAVSYYYQKDEEKGGSIIRNLSDEIVTKEFLATVIEVKSLRENYALQLAIHARRLYNLDDAIPDKWIMSMFD